MLTGMVQSGFSLTFPLESMVSATALFATVLPGCSGMR